MISGNQLFILMAIVALVVLVGFVFFIRNKRREVKALTPLAGLAFGCIVAGITLGNQSWLGYGLIGLGVILSVIDAVLKLRKRD